MEDTGSLSKLSICKLLLILNDKGIAKQGHRSQLSNRQLFMIIFTFMIVMSSLSTFRTFLQYLYVVATFLTITATSWIWNIHF